MPTEYVQHIHVFIGPKRWRHPSWSTCMMTATKRYIDYGRLSGTIWSKCYSHCSTSSSCKQMYVCLCLCLCGTAWCSAVTIWLQYVYLLTNMSTCIALWKEQFLWTIYKFRTSSAYVICFIRVVSLAGITLLLFSIFSKFMHEKIATR